MRLPENDRPIDQPTNRPIERGWTKVTKSATIARSDVRCRRRREFIPFAPIDFWMTVLPYTDDHRTQEVLCVSHANE